ncbi:MAG TPA: Gfo/Idh/MocA family oxidoreductase [Tepidiformaceae bacterium]|nr:Gfo/Idh/MocA family oxidoreductase [Tepidiformaceae bacterium]
MKLAVSGAGRVFERLYAPALRGLPDFELVGVADPRPDNVALAAFEAPVFPSLGQLLAEVDVDGVVVLSPPAMHVPDAAAALERGLPVLVEKPVCQSLAELEQLPVAAAEKLLTPAFSRRYWPAYRKLAGRRPLRALRLAIRVDPAAWDAHSGPADLVEDLFPHVADLARWLTLSEIERVSGRRSPEGVEVELMMGDGAVVTARLDSGPAYREAVRAGGKPHRVGPPAREASIARRILGHDDPPVAATRAMLADWARTVRGERPPLLAGFSDGAATVAAMDLLRVALA